MTDAETVERARRAKIAYDEFYGPIFGVVEVDYIEKMIEVSASANPRTPEMITRLALGVQVARQFRAQFDTIIAAGEVAKDNIERAERMGAMPPAKRRLASI